MTGAMDDYREPGVTMDWKRAEELCRKMKRKIQVERAKREGRL
jgi:hypothetical protein